MKYSGLLLLSFIPITAIIVLFVYVIYRNYFIQMEALTTMDAGNILPVLYDSSLTNKSKITDLLGIPVEDTNYNELLNSKAKDPDEIIASIKTYIGSTISFKEIPPPATGSTSTETPAPTSTTKSETAKNTPTDSASLLGSISKITDEIKK